MYYTGEGLDLVDGLFLTVAGAERLREILDSDMPAAQKRVEMVRAISSLILGGYLIANVQVSSNIRSIKSNLSNRINKTNGFKLEYSDVQIQHVKNKGQALGLDDKTIEDFLFIGSRSGKPINYLQLVDQMKNWKKIAERGYPFKFENLEEFVDFSNDLKKRLKENNIPANDVRIQGSSLRTKAADDLDLAIIISEKEFDNFLIKKYNKKISKDGKVIDMTNMSNKELSDLADDVINNSSIYKPKNLAFGDFAYTFTTQTINAQGSKNIVPNLRSVRDEIQSIYPDLKIKNISIQTKKSKFNINPYLNI